MHWQRITTPAEHQLVYRAGPALVLALVLMLVGAALALGTAQQLIAAWPQNRAALVLETLVAAGIFGAGAGLLRSRQIVIDRIAARVSRSSRWLLWTNEAAHDLAGFESVGWHVRRSHDAVRFPITLNGPGREPLELFELVLMDDARSHAAEVAAFLGWRCDHWDEKLIEAATRREDVPGGPGGPRALVWQLVGRQSMRRVQTDSPHRLVFRQSFETFLRVLGALALPMGLLFLFSPWLGVEIGGGGRDPLAPWAARLIGGVFALLGIVFLLGRRGLTFDRDSRTVALWWGLPRPLWSRRYDVADVTRVELSPVVRDTAASLGVVWQAALAREDDDSIVVFRSPIEQEARNVAEQVARFLRCEPSPADGAIRR